MDTQITQSARRERSSASRYRPAVILTALAVPETISLILCLDLSHADARSCLRPPSCIYSISRAGAYDKRAEKDSDPPLSIAFALSLPPLSLPLLSVPPSLSLSLSLSLRLTDRLSTPSPPPTLPPAPGSGHGHPAPPRPARRRIILYFIMLYYIILYYIRSRASRTPATGPWTRPGSGASAWAPPSPPTRSSSARASGQHVSLYYIISYHIILYYISHFRPGSVASARASPSPPTREGRAVMPCDTA